MVELTRQEVEQAILIKFLELLEIVDDYYPKDKYFTICRGAADDDQEEDFIHFNNAYWEHVGEGELQKSYHVKGGEWK